MDTKAAEGTNKDKRSGVAPRILVVEDDMAMKSLVMKAVQTVRPQSEICFASSLEEAFAKILQFSDISEQQPCEMIIADIFLEGSGTGLDLWRVLRTTYPKIPFLVISSVNEKDLKSSIEKSAGAAEAGGLLYLKKPFTVSSCAQKIQSILKREAIDNNFDDIPNDPAPANAKALMGSDERQQQMAQLLMLKLSADWLSRQEWLDEPYGGQNPAQELLFHTRISANRLWEDFFVSQKDHLTLDKAGLREHIQQLSELTPELKEFLNERLSQIESVFHSH